MAISARARETFVDLRHAIAKIEGRLVERLDTPDEGLSDRLPAHLPAEMSFRLRQPALPTGVASFDAALGGGLPLAGLVELHGEAVRDSGATAGLALAFSQLLIRHKPLPETLLLWISTTEMARESGRPYAPGLAERFGLAADCLVMAQAARPVDALWIAEEAANAGVFASILVELRGAPAVLDLTARRRLHRRSLLGGRPLFMIQHAGAQQPTAAPLRLVVRPARATPRRTLSGELPGSIGPPAFSIDVAKSRAALASHPFMLEWTHNAFRQQAAHSRPLVSMAPRRAAAAPPSRTVVAFPSAADSGAPGVQLPAEQHPARRGA